MPAFWMIVSRLPVRLHGRVREARLGGFSTGEIVFWRGLVSMLMMVGLAASRGIGLKTPHWKMHLSRSVSGLDRARLLLLRDRPAAAGDPVTLNYTSPLFVALVLALFFGERLRAIAVCSRSSPVSLAWYCCCAHAAARPMVGALAGLGARPASPT